MWIWTLYTQCQNLHLFGMSIGKFDNVLIFGARSFAKDFETIHTMSKFTFIRAMSIRTFRLTIFLKLLVAFLWSNQWLNICIINGQNLTFWAYLVNYKFLYKKILRKNLVSCLAPSEKITDFAEQSCVFDQFSICLFFQELFFADTTPLINQTYLQCHLIIKTTYK